MSDSQITPEVYHNYGNYDEMYDEIVENNEINADKKLPVLVNLTLYRILKQQCLTDSRLNFINAVKKNLSISITE